MTMQKSIGLAAIVAAILIAAVPLAAKIQSQSQTQSPTKPEPKPDIDPKAATAATLAGKWAVNVNNPNGAMQMSLELKNDEKDSKKITGTISGMMGDAVPVEGEVVDGKLSFRLSGRDVVVAFTGTQQKDGSLAGTLDFGRGPMNWTATREKK